MIVRPVGTDDLSQLMALSQQGEKGMTTLPTSEPQWLSLIERSQAAFACLPHAPSVGSAAYLLVLEEPDGSIAGTSAVYAPLGHDRPFYNYKVTRVTNIAHNHNLRVDTDLLQLMNDYDGAAEVGTLILRHEYRGGGRGRLLALARYMLIGAFMGAFPEMVMAEMRGWRDPDTEHTPFWDAVGKRFFTMPFDEADVLSGRDHRFIADLMPRIPIYTALLPDEAQAAIGRPHVNAKPAYDMLIKQGFRYNNNVDIFDAGPCLEVRKGDIVTVRRTRRATLGDALTETETPSKPQWVVACTDPQHFAVAYGYPETGDKAAGGVRAPACFHAASQLSTGADVNTSPLEITP